MKSKPRIATIALLLGLGSSINAQISINEPFTYSDGNLVGNGGWSAHSGAGSSAVQVSSGAIVIDHGSGSREDVGLTFTEATSSVLSAQFDLTVNDDAAITGTDFEYFAHFMSEGSFNFTSRLDVVAANTGGNDYTLGLATTSSTAEATYATDLTFGETYSIVLSYNFATGLSSLTVDGGATISSTSVVFQGGLDRFALRQSDSSSDETITVDNLVITGVPESGTFALLAGLSTLTFVMLRRRES